MQSTFQTQIHPPPPPPPLFKLQNLKRELTTLQQNSHHADISKITNLVSLQKCIFSETAYVCVLTYHISSFLHNSNKFQTGKRWGGVIPPSPLIPKRTPKKPTLIS